MATGSRFLILDPEGRDEGDAAAAAVFHLGAVADTDADADAVFHLAAVADADAAVAAAAAPGVQPHENEDGVDHLTPGSASWGPFLSRVRTALLIVGAATAAAAAVRGMLQIPLVDSRPSSTVPGVVPDLLEHQFMWSSIPRGGTSIAVSQAPDVHVSSEALPVDQISPGVVPDLLEHQFMWSSIPRGGTSVALSEAPGMVTNMLEHQLVWPNVPRGGTSITLPQDLGVHVSSEALPVDQISPDIHVGSEALPAYQISPGPSAPPSHNMNDLVPWAMHHILKGTSIAVPRDNQRSGTLASEPGPSTTVGPWSASWMQGTIYWINFLVVIVLLIAAAVAMLQDP